MSEPEMMTTREVADYLRIKERKIYDLVQRGAIPCSRVTGKWLFRRALIDQWVSENSQPAAGRARAPDRPRIVAGSHDPLLEWAVRAARTDLAVMFDGSLDGLTRFADGSALLCGLHVFDPQMADYNVGAASRRLSGLPFVLIEWAWRERGLIVPPGNPLGLRGLADLPASGARLVDRQEGAGARILLQHLLERSGLDPAAIPLTATPARNETEVALAVLDGKADAGFGIAAVARHFRLDFIPLQRERYDLAVSRRDYFEPPVQTLLGFTRTEAFAEKAAELAGYDVATTGRVVHNAP